MLHHLLVSCELFLLLFLRNLLFLRQLLSLLLFDNILLLLRQLLLLHQLLLEHAWVAPAVIDCGSVASRCRDIRFCRIALELH